MEVTPTQFRRSVTKDTVDTKEAPAQSNCKNNVTITPQQPSIMRTLVKLPEEQTKGLNFPLGCPVWYNFSQSSCFSGVVQTVHLDIVQKKLVYTVSRKKSHSKSDTNDKFKQSLVLDTVSESCISYAFNCPVTLTSKSDDDAGDDGDDSSNKNMAGEIMFAENVEDEMLYVVKLIPSGVEEGGESHIIRFEDGVKASRLRYREVVAKAVPSKHVKKDCGHTSNVGVEKVLEAVSSSEEEHSLEEKLVVQQRPNQALNVGDRAVSTEQCSSKKKMQLQKKPQPNKKKAEIKYKQRNNNHKNSYYGPSTNSKAKFPRRNSRDEFGRMPRKKKDGNKSRGGPKKNAGQDHQVQASLGGGASSSQAFKQQKVENAEKALPIKWEPPAPKQQSCLHYENDGAI